MIENSTTYRLSYVGMAQVRWLEPDEQRTWRAFLQASHQLWEQLDRELQHEAGLPMAYYQVLVMLSEAPNRILRMSDLATRTWSSRSRLSHAIDRLEEKGWVRRTSCPSDRRGAFAELTDEGLAVLRAAAPSHVESVRRHLFDQLQPTQLAALGEISQAIADRLES
jgi:DNA-binding MarR family transcriptional regulator